MQTIDNTVQKVPDHPLANTYGKYCMTLVAPASNHWGFFKANPEPCGKVYPRRTSFMTRKRSILRLIVIFCVLVPMVATAQQHAIDTAASTLTVRAFKTGLFSGFADNHEIEATITEGSLDEAAGYVKFAVDSRRMKVLDPQMNPGRRQEIQERMLGPEVLDSSRFAQITFESTSVERPSNGIFVVHGQLSLHGVTRPVVVNVHSENGEYKGTCTLKQRDYGIAPISIAGGTVKVKDELKIEFDIRTSASAAGGASKSRRARSGYD
jgi:polyisoprenoid-binding protein YceI